MTLFSKENKHVLVPIYYLDKEAITFSYVSPTYTLESIDANIIGEKVLNVARYVDSLDPS